MAAVLVSLDVYLSNAQSYVGIADIGLDQFLIYSNYQSTFLKFIVFQLCGAQKIILRRIDEIFFITSLLHDYCTTKSPQRLLNLCEQFLLCSQLYGMSFLSVCQGFWKYFSVLHIYFLFVIWGCCGVSPCHCDIGSVSIYNRLVFCRYYSMLVSSPS